MRGGAICRRARLLGLMHQEILRSCGHAGGASILASGALGSVRVAGGVHPTAGRPLLQVASPQDASPDSPGDLAVLRSCGRCIHSCGRGPSDPGGLREVHPIPGWPLLQVAPPARCIPRLHRGSCGLAVLREVHPFLRAGDIAGWPPPARMLCGDHVLFGAFSVAPCNGV